MDYILLIISLVLIIVGAQFLVDGSSAIAKHYHVPEFVIGLTIVGIGTSMPEFVISLFSTIQGKGDMAIGNIVGSNLANILLILGLTAVIRPVVMTKSNISMDLPYCIFVTLVLLLMCFGAQVSSSSYGAINRIEGAILLAMFLFFMFYSFRKSTIKKENLEEQAEIVADKQRPKPMWLSIIFVLMGLAGLVLGGDLFVDSATKIARHWGVSESVIAITLIAIGTSLPELATSIVAAIKGKSQLALGNIIGSNVSNITFILGTCALVRPIQTGGITPFDIYAVLLASIMLLLSIFTFKKNTLDRVDGSIFLAVYIGYIIILITRS